jgi:hypothetical protein
VLADHVRASSAVGVTSLMCSAMRFEWPTRCVHAAPSCLDRPTASQAIREYRAALIARRG